MATKTRRKVESFIKGMGSVLDFSGSLTSIHERRPRKSAIESYKGDWAAVGQDFKEACSRMEANIYVGRPKKG